MNDHNNNIQLETAMTTTTMTMIQALRSAMDVMLERDDNVVVFGQDVGYFGGVFRCTEGLQNKYGTSRVFDAPISESGIVGTAVGMGAYGLRPVVEMRVGDVVHIPPQVKHWHGAAPGSTMALMPPAEPRETSGMKIQRKDPTVVGQAQDKCGNLIDARQRREAIINQRVIAGMSQQDVESALGKPNKVNIRTSTTSYRYDLKRGRSAQIDFDERGCVKAKAKSRTAKSPR